MFYVLVPGRSGIVLLLRSITILAFSGLTGLYLYKVLCAQ